MGPTMDDQAIGSCFGCGCVGKRLRNHQHVILEATATDRRYGKLWWGNSQSAWPWCIKERTDFGEEINGVDENGDLGAQTLPILLRNRECPEWFRYEPFRDPSEHLQDEKALRLEEQRRQWQTDLEGDRRRFESDMEAARQKYEAARAEERHLGQIEEHRDNRRWHIIELLVAVASIVITVAVSVAVAAYFTGDGGSTTVINNYNPTAIAPPNSPTPSGPVPPTVTQP